MDPQKITELANLLRNNGDKILSSEFTFTLSGALLRALNDSFKLIADCVDIAGAPIIGTTFQVVKPNNHKSPVFSDLQLVHDFVQKTTLLCIIHYPSDDYFEGVIDISKFGALQRLEIQKTNVTQIIGIHKLRPQLQQLVCIKSLQNVEDIIVKCGGDNSNGFVWNELKSVDFSYNNLKTIDSSLEFAQYLQHLNLRHNQLHSVEAIKWLPNLKSIDLSYNNLQCIPQFHVEAYKRLQSLNMSNNFLEDLMGISKCDALTDLNLSDNCLMDHTYLLPLSALITLKFLNLYGNPLSFHPKHRLATAQFLHKNTATVKFILDFEPLSKSEKAITGTQQMRHPNTFDRYMSKSSSISFGRRTPTGSIHTPSSSVGSLLSFHISGSTTTSEPTTEDNQMVRKNWKKPSKMRTVVIEDDNPSEITEDFSDQSTIETNTMTSSLIQEESNTKAELQETKKHIENLREKFGEEWLQSGNADMMQSALGIEVPAHVDNEIYHDNYYKDKSNTTLTNRDDSQLMTSTPTTINFLDDTFKSKSSLSPIKYNKNKEINNDSSAYMSVNTSKTSATEQSVFKTPNESSTSLNPFEESGASLNPFEENDEIMEDEAPHLKYAYSTNPDEESEDSEPEEDEETYIVYSNNPNESIFLTISSTCLRERDTLTQKTTNKWSFNILESCDRLKSNTLRINFDTIRRDRQERIYTVEDGLCQDLEKKLRAILSKRDLTEMNQTIYRCVQCSCQFSHEIKKNPRANIPESIRCPDCKSKFIAEIHNIPKSLDKSTLKEEYLSPAAIVEESRIAVPLVMESSAGASINLIQKNEETISIGSANSLNGSSSCSKLSGNSHSSFDSNQSVVGSTNTDRDNGFRSNCESDVDILSNPSQSSIEVLDYSSRKTSEERRLSLIPNLDNITDLSYQDILKNVQSNLNTGEELDTLDRAKEPNSSKNTANPLTQFQLTESSSSGSVTDSICTTYEQQSADTTISSTTNGDKIASSNLLATETFAGQHEKQRKKKDTWKNEMNTIKNEDSGISTMFGAIFQSTNVLMSSSKKLIDVEASSKIQTGTVLPEATKQSDISCKPYKFNYVKYNDIDHRLKLYFYQTKFEEAGEHFKWVARGWIFNENNYTLREGLVVMSTIKCYVMEAFAPENDDVTKWLKQIVSVTVSRLERIQLLPWKLGLSFTLKGCGIFTLLLRDILRTDSLLLHFSNDALPSDCELDYQPSVEISNRLNSSISGEKLKMCSILNGCEITCDTAKRTFSMCGLLTSDSFLYVTSDNMNWLCVQNHPNVDTDVKVCVMQSMNNLIDVKKCSDNCFALNFLDEKFSKFELWTCTFVTKENAESCLNAIEHSWEQLFGVPLMNTM